MFVSWVYIACLNIASFQFLKVHPDINGAIGIGDPVRRHRPYTDHMISNQETAIEHLRYVRRQLEKDDAELKKLQDQLNTWMYPRKWTPYNSTNPHDRE